MGNRIALESGTQLHWYVIKEVLGQGGFGITYLAEDSNLGQLVAIKEYLPTEIAMREEDDSVHPNSDESCEQYLWGLERFITEAKTLSQFKHDNIVQVLTVFTDHNTAYMVMDYEEGQSLQEILKQRKALSEQELSTILKPLLDGLEEVHEMGFVHRDIKPGNIYLRQDGEPVLLDFGSARQALSEKTQTLTTLVSPGFAPFEQYVSKSDKQGPWTDIYGLGATLYRVVAGSSPMDAMERSAAILHTGEDNFVSASEIAPEGYSQKFLSAIDHALCFKPEQRPKSIVRWRRDFLFGYDFPSQGDVKSKDEVKEDTKPEQTNGVTRKNAFMVESIMSTRIEPTITGPAMERVDMRGSDVIESKRKESIQIEPKEVEAGGKIVPIEVEHGRKGSDDEPRTFRKVVNLFDRLYHGLKILSILLAAVLIVLIIIYL